MAPLKARLLSARTQARRAPIIPTTIEQQLGGLDIPVIVYETYHKGEPAQEGL